MVYKNGLKEYLMTTVLFGGAMGLFYGLSTQSIIMGLILGIISGCLFTLLIFLFVKFQEKKFDKMRVEIAKERKIICDGGATLNGNGGWLFFTERGLEFYPHKINLSRDTVSVSMNTIKSVKTVKNQIVIETADTPRLAIVVSHNKEWKMQIEAYKKKPPVSSCC